MRALSASLILLLAACAPAPIGEYRSKDDRPSTERDESEEGEEAPVDSGAPANGTFTLTVNLLGSGAGTVVSTPSGLTCQSKTCTGTFPAGTTVGLVPAPATGSTFTGWGGACSGADTCTPVLNADVTVTATLDLGSSGLTGTFTGNYTHSATASGCTFNNQGTLSVTFAPDGASLGATASITGLQLRSLPGCNLVTSTATGTSQKEAVTVNGSGATGTWTFTVQGAAGNLALAYNATVNGNTISGMWTCPTCSGSFTLTKQ